MSDRIEKALKILKKIGKKFPERGVKEISMMIGIHFSQFYRWELGQKPTLESMLKLDEAVKRLKI
jgi:hypothetical protein